MSQQPSPEETAVNEYMECRQVLDRARAIFRLHAKTLDMIRFALCVLMLFSGLAGSGFWVISD